MLNSKEAGLRDEISELKRQNEVYQKLAREAKQNAERLLRYHCEEFFDWLQDHPDELDAPFRVAYERWRSGEGEECPCCGRSCDC